MRRLLLAASLLAALASCSDLGETPPPAGPATRLSLTPVTFEQLPGWAADRHGAVLPALLKSCRRIEARPLDKPLDATGVAGIVTDWQPACAAARGLDPANHAAVRYFFESYFTPYLAAGDDNPNGLFTGYYEAELHGSRRPSKRYRYPIYAAPDDLAAVKQSGGGKYHTRAQIAGGALKGRGLELLWVDDPVDAFFLSVQGSGRVAMDDGSVVRVGYAGDNGHEYKSIGRELIARGIIPRERLSMPTPSSTRCRCRWSSSTRTMPSST